MLTKMLMPAVLILLIPVIVAAQKQGPVTPGAADSAKKQQALMNELLDLSRPGSNHAILGTLAGTWNFRDTRLAFVKGTLVRKPIYNGRFYTVEVTGGKLQVPVANQQMKEEFYQSMQIEGYDNAAMKFVATSINNHIGSDIQFQTGTYDPTAHAFTFEWNSELVPGERISNKRVIRITGNDHYTEEYYELQNGKDVKVRTLDYTRTGQ
jgi:hypothetical protein